MKRLISVLMMIALCTALLAAAGAEDAAPIAMTFIPVDAQDMRVGQCLIPEGYQIRVVPDYMVSDRSITDPMGLALVAMSPDTRTVMSYEKSNTYIDIVSSTMGGEAYRTHEEGKYDAQTMTPMHKYMEPATYARAYLEGIYPGVEMTRTGSVDMSEYQPALQQFAQAKYNALKESEAAVPGLSIDGVAFTADMCGFSCMLNGDEYNIIVATLIDATQMTVSADMFMGQIKETEIIWSPLFTYMLSCPASETESLLPAFEAFMKNTTVSDQFTEANVKLADELRNVVVESRTTTIAETTKNFLSGEDTYNDDRYTDYIFDQNDYTLSDGTHVKIPTEYEYVYEGDNNTVYFSSSAFQETGTQLTPNR